MDPVLGNETTIGGRRTVGASRLPTDAARLGVIRTHGVDSTASGSRRMSYLEHGGGVPGRQEVIVQVSLPPRNAETSTQCSEVRSNDGQ